MSQASTIVSEMTTHSNSPFHLRPAKPTPTDHAFILSAFDSSLPLLASIGSHEQWGSTPFSQRGDFPQETLKELDQSEEYRLTGKSNMDGLRIFIVEREYHHDNEDHTGSLSSHLRVTSDGQCFLPVGFAYVRENWVPKYVKSQHHLPMPIIHSSTEIGGFLYLEVMITDSRVGRLCRGAGAALIRGMREYAQGRGMKAQWVDGWAGNERKLIRYYEQQGFRAVGDWSHTRANNVPWLGTLMCMEI
ncbi:hypothetical protein CBS115989_10554 [Aspergillus niger]|uniref:N-acetyltransferase domain-containing protein n=1 Tax=Aspergillus niger ATCC 13496 TaxID=1353008 RepID=A0A370C3J7_ASPNG|nr:hypothetical protein CBS115989_10554 [Aspergillus niger]KAI2835274.1 hypothetical protein CBS11232_10568 [Aspergillus niger]KAI2868397.1 hypothetical protein CBS115988_10726 [Aspergillus niger]RDH22445.1 hypothetical protein M747DRAFT_329789 [Aspergillus niger ATCC 13496]|eukprot:XP_001396798.2 hypothetical protein ANI_1_1306134 [Aspergillus niger CBS 513.88]